MDKPRILLADDESILRMDLHEMLSEAGYEVVGEAGDGEKAVELAHARKPDLIIMDIKMPRMNGLKASKIISSSLRIPILLLTAYSQKDFVEQAKQANIVGYIVKPIRESDLLPAVEIALAQAKRLAILEQDVAALQKKLEGRRLIEKAKGILMEKYAWTEEKAYQAMRKVSMENRISMERVARRILEQEEAG